MASPSKDILSRDAFLNLVRLHERLNGQFTELFREEGLTQAWYNVLRILRGGPREGAPCQYIGERLLTRVPDVTRLIDRMVAAGLVERLRSEEDRRVVLVRVTRDGRSKCRRMDGPVMELHKKQFSHLKVGDLARLNQCLLDALSGA